MSIKQAILDSIDEELSDDHEMYRLCVEVKNRYLNGEYPLLNDFISQKSGKQFTIYDAYALTDFLYHVHSGNILIQLVGVSSTPYSDSEIVKNNDVLRTITTPFMAEFIPSTGGHTPQNDGYLWWEQPVQLCDNSSERGMQVVKVSPLDNARLNLEVGTFDSYKYFCYKNRASYGIARWAYGHNTILVAYFTSAFQSWIIENRSKMFDLDEDDLDEDNLDGNNSMPRQLRLL